MMPSRSWPIRWAAWSRSGWPASSHAMTASTATVGARRAAHAAHEGLGIIAASSRRATLTMAWWNRSISRRNSGSRAAWWNSSRNPSGSAAAVPTSASGGSILLNWFHPAIPLDPPPGWLVSLVYGLPPLAAVFAWHLFLQRLAHRRQREPVSYDSGPVLPGQDSLEDEQDKQDSASAHLPPAPEPAGDPRGLIRAMLATETPEAPVGWQQVQALTGLSRSRAYALLRQERAARAGGNGQQPSGRASGASVPAPSRRSDARIVTASMLCGSTRLVDVTLGR